MNGEVLNDAQRRDVEAMSVLYSSTINEGIHSRGNGDLSPSAVNRKNGSNLMQPKQQYGFYKPNNGYPPLNETFGAVSYYKLDKDYLD